MCPAREEDDTDTCIIRSHTETRNKSTLSTLLLILLGKILSRYRGRMRQRRSHMFTSIDTLRGPYCWMYALFSNCTVCSLCTKTKERIPAPKRHTRRGQRRDDRPYLGANSSWYSYISGPGLTNSELQLRLLWRGSSDTLPLRVLSRLWLYIHSLFRRGGGGGVADKGQKRGRCLKQNNFSTKYLLLGLADLSVWGGSVNSCKVLQQQ